MNENEWMNIFHSTIQSLISNNLVLACPGWDVISLRDVIIFLK